jgi:threonine synthase
MGRRLRVFVSPSADVAVVAQLDALGAERVVCVRQPGDPEGDPCYLRFREAVAAGHLPFSCQGGDNALALVGGHTLGWELIEQSLTCPFNHVYIQVGGGALASSILQSFLMAQAAGIIRALPRFYAVQTANAHPMARAWTEFQRRGATLAYAGRHRSEFMWPWEQAPQSVAGGILDDETYDWLSILHGLVASGGGVITVSEARLVRAQRLARAQTGIAVDITGAAGFAGLLRARVEGRAAEPGDLVLFTGAIR